MFGTLRFIFAILVVLNHLLSGEIFDYGISAVIGFFIISGYVMTILIQRSYGKLGKSTWYFYADRFLRIYPQYFIFVVLTQIADLAWYFSDSNLHTGPTTWKFFLNAILIPVNYYNILTDSISQYVLLPQAWSLGLEEQFYWIFPFLLLVPWLGRISCIISLGIFAAATFGILNNLLFAMRLLPGFIFIFILGKNLAEYNLTKRKEALWTILSLYIATLILAIGLWRFGFLIGVNRPLLLGIIVTFPIIAFLSRLPRRKWDEIIGQSSYGIFLCHMLVINTLIHFRLFTNGLYTFVSAVILISIALGFAGYYLVEKMVNPFRFALRKRHSLSLQSLHS